MVAVTRIAPHLALTALALGVCSASAQTSSVPDEGALQEIVVTAERREARLQETPIAVTALTSSMLEDLQILRSADVQRAVPGLKLIENVASPTTVQVSLRGSTQQDTAIVVAESPIGFYIDDVYVARVSVINTALSDIERVEVLRGPQGTLYGRNTLSGAVKFVTRDPDREPWADVTIGYGRFGAYRAGFTAGGRLPADGWSGSFSALANGGDGYFDNALTGAEIGAERNWSARGKLRYAPSESFSGTLSLSHTDSDNDSSILVPGIAPAGQFRSSAVRLVAGDYRVLTAPVPGAAAPFSARPNANSQQTMASLHLEWRTRLGTVRSITAGIDTDEYYASDLSGVGAVFTGTGASSRQYSQELQLLGGAPEDDLQYLVGAYYFRDRASQFVGTLIPGAVTSREDVRLRTESTALFGQLTWRFAERWSVTAGARWTEDEKRFQGADSLGFPQLPAAPGFTFASDDSFSKTTSRLALDYYWDAPTGTSLDSLLGYAAVSTGFKSGGYNAIAFGNPVVLQTVYGPETNRTYELGVKTDWLRRTVRVNAAAFLTDTDNLAANATVSSAFGPAFPVVNVGDARIRGLELEASATPLRGLTLFANLTWQRGRYGSLIPGSAPVIARATFGRAELPQLPDLAGSAGFTYSTLAGNGWRWTIGADVYHTDDYFIAVGNDLLIDAYDIFNAFLSVEPSSHLEIRLSGANLGDRNEIISGIRDFGGYLQQAPRSFMLTARYRIGED